MKSGHSDSFQTTVEGPQFSAFVFLENRRETKELLPGSVSVLGWVWNPQMQQHVGDFFNPLILQKNCASVQA
jgi:hypothetical protein